MRARQKGTRAEDGAQKGMLTVAIAKSLLIRGFQGSVAGTKRARDGAPPHISRPPGPLWESHAGETKRHTSRGRSPKGDADRGHRKVPANSRFPRLRGGHQTGSGRCPATYIATPRPPLGVPCGRDKKAHEPRTEPKRGC